MKVKKIIDRLIFNTTKKPECYKRVEKAPKTSLQKLLHPQRARQQQYNNWWKRNGVYNGSYLPENPNLLLKRGWVETTSPNNQTGNSRDFQRKSSKQMIRYDSKTYKKGRWEDEHYHWKTGKSINENRKISDDKKYMNRYGNTCAKDSPESHLAPKDKDFIFRK